MSDEGTVSRCLVFCRLRPSVPKDFEDDAFKLVSMDKKRIILKDERNYDFDGTFDQDCKQEDIFETVAVPCVKHAFNGFCSALMAYGQTGTGKSFTLCCTKPGVEGVIPRAAKLIYEIVASRPDDEITITGQFVQIYRDQLGDLMTEGGRDKVDIRWEKETGVTLLNCSIHELKSEREFMDFYDEGNKRRVTTATAMNPESSRGHSAMVVMIQCKKRDDESGPCTKGKLTFIDLAGYERFSKTGISNADPIMKDEAKTINASLLSLGHVVTSLSNNDKHIPWRNSKLTRILQDSIGGRSRTSIILTVGPSSEHFHETTNSLQFGQRAMAVKVEARMSVTTDYEKLAAKLQGMLDERDEKINLLEVQIRARDNERAEMAERHRRDDEELRGRFQVQLDEMKANGASDEQIRKLEEVFQVEVENLKEQQIEETEYQEEIHNKTIVDLAAEQQRRERRKQVEMKVAQEKIIQEFERKLQESGGSNEDLVAAMGKIAEKDSLLAVRSSEAAALQMQVQELTALLEEAGVPIPEMEEVPETFLDVSQVEEMQLRSNQELTRLNALVVDLRAEVETLQETLGARTQEVASLLESTKSMSAVMEQAGLTVEGGTQFIRRMVDAEELASVRHTLQQEINRLTSTNERLSSELEKATVSEARLDATSSLPPETPRTRSRGLSITRATVQLKKDTDDAEKRTMKERLTEAERRLVNLARECNLATAHAAQMKEICTRNGIDVEDAVVPDTAAGLHAMEELLIAKNNEVESMLAIVASQEKALEQDRLAKAHAESQVHALTRRLQEHSVEVPSSPPAPAVTGGVDMKSFMAFVKAARETSAKAAKANLEATGIKVPEIIAAALSEKDSQIVEHEAELLEGRSTIAQMAALIANLTAQIEGAGGAVMLPPSADLKAALERERAQRLEGAEEAAKALEDKIKRQNDEKEKIQSILNSMAEDRSRETRAYLERQHELERRLQEEQARAQQLEEAHGGEESNSLLDVISTLKQKVADRDEELARITHELMKFQAEALGNTGGLFAKVKRKFA